ncbi:MAG: hypothetical protein A07HR60_00154 [uncultured archaeon A07HR60]|nr:MAG: hypothetical protein A07HR60_00154 [uncultured archaeon A07HR60]
MLRLRAEQATALEGDLEAIDSCLLQAHNQVTESIFRVHTPREQSLDWSGRSSLPLPGDGQDRHRTAADDRDSDSFADILCRRHACR